MMGIWSGYPGILDFWMVETGMGRFNKTVASAICSVFLPSHWEFCFAVAGRLLMTGDIQIAYGGMRELYSSSSSREEPPSPPRSRPEEMSFPEPPFLSRSARARRRTKITIREFAGDGPSLESCACRVCGPCLRDAERGCRWCRDCIDRRCWRKHEEKGRLEALVDRLVQRAWRGRRRRRKKGDDDRGESVVYYVGDRED
ncbi:hypothetical protein VTH06DRAFT_3444 [Thermothelomyces fergusii]